MCQNNKEYVLSDFQAPNANKSLEANSPASNENASYNYKSDLEKDVILSPAAQKHLLDLLVMRLDMTVENNDECKVKDTPTAHAASRLNICCTEEGATDFRRCPNLAFRIRLRSTHHEICEHQ